MMIPDKWTPVDLVSRQVQCLRCGKMMRQAERLAPVRWIWSDGSMTETTLLRYECDTPDCGNVVRVESQ